MLRSGTGWRPLRGSGLPLPTSIAAAILLIALLACKATPEQEKKWAAERQAVVEKLESHFGTLAKIYANAKSNAHEPKACDPAMAENVKAVGGAPKRISVVYLPYLERFASPKDKSKWKPDESEWAWISASGWRGPFDKHPSDEPDSWSLKRLADSFPEERLPRRYLVVVAPEGQNAMPKVSSGGDFEAGHFQGWALLFDLTDASVACSFPLNVASSDEVTFKKRGLFSKSPEQAVTVDFQDNFKDALQQGVPNGVDLIVD